MDLKSFLVASLFSVSCFKVSISILDRISKMATTKNEKMEKEGKQCLKNVSVEEVKQVFAKDFIAKLKKSGKRLNKKVRG